MTNCTQPMLLINGHIRGFTWTNFKKPNVKIIPCGKCVACKLTKSNEWKNRMLIESYCWKHTYFITLTYDNDHIKKKQGVSITGELKNLPTLNHEDMTKFIKRLRKHFQYYYNEKIKYFYCSEYGPKTKRPHYHMILFTNVELLITNIGKTKIQNDNGINDLILEKWGLGNIGISKFESACAAYVARYTLKKINTEKQPWSKFDKLEKEKIYMSKRPAIGYQYINKNFENIKENRYKVIPKTNDPNFWLPKTYYNRLKKDNYLTDKQIENLKNYKEKRVKKTIKQPQNKREFKEMLDKIKQQEYIYFDKAKKLKRNF
nr:MAG: replication initiation protein [Microvirus Sku122]